jgi:hypothetical protein
MPATPVYCSTPLLQPTYQVQYAGNATPTYEISIDRSLWFSTKVTNDVDPCQPGSQPCKD